MRILVKSNYVVSLSVCGYLFRQSGDLYPFFFSFQILGYVDENNLLGSNYEKGDNIDSILRTFPDILSLINRRNEHIYIYIIHM